MKKDQILCEYGDVFEGIGCLPGEYNIEVDLEKSPVIHAPRKIPVAIRDTVKEELKKMEENGIIARITEPTSWVSSMVVVPKKNNQVRVCIDPRDLNTRDLKIYNAIRSRTRFETKTFVIQNKNCE